MIDYEKEKFRRAQDEIENIIKAGAPIVKLDIFDILDKYVPSEQIKNKIEYTGELYLDLVSTLKEYPEEDQTIFLKALKDSDVIDNQSIENEDTFLIALHQKFERIFSIDLLLDVVCSDNYFTKDNFVKIHDTLLLGTSSENKQGLRDNDLKFVGSYQIKPQTKFFVGNRAISYFPIKHTEIDAAIDKFLDFYNSGARPNNKYDIMLLPMICHGLIAALQLFKDGNTRYGRLLQNVLMYKLANEQLGLDLQLPIVYATRQYAAFREEYRDKVTKIVLNNDEQAWEDWINFNLKRIQDGIYYNMNCLNSLVTHKKR